MLHRAVETPVDKVDIATILAAYHICKLLCQGELLLWRSVGNGFGLYLWGSCQMTDRLN